MAPPPASDWLSSGGAYILIWGAWIATAAFFTFVAFGIGKATDSENDGCILAIMNILLTLFGGGAGLFLFSTNYPLFVATSILGAITLPSLGSLALMARMRRR